MKVLNLVGTAFIIIWLLLPNAVANALDQNHSHALSSSTQQAFTPSPRNELSALADRDWMAGLQSNIAAYEYRASPNSHGLQAPNRAHNLRTYFEPTGIRLHDRSNIGSTELTGLSLVRLGRGSALTPVEAGKVTYEGSRVEIRRDRILEWYENSPKGLEQGFTLKQQPQGEGPLVLELAIEGAQAVLDGRSVVLTTDQGRRLRYSKLFVKDASGKLLNSRLALPSPRQIQLVIQDTGASYPLLIDPLITDVPDAILESNDEWSGGFDSAMFGASVSNAGDVNGDGFSDVIVGAFGWDNGLFDEGAAFVFLGSANGIVGTDPTTANAMLLSGKAAAEFGWSVSGAGDVNGDGYGDIVVGAHFYDSTLPSDPTLGVDGAAFVFLGSPAGIVGSGTSTAHASIFGPVIDSRLGHAVSAAGDVNGDGFGDIILGMPRLGIPFPCSVATPPTCSIPINDSQGAGGAALIFLGSPAGIIGSGIDDADHVILPYPPGQPVLTSQQLGADVAAAGDVNNDGFDDVIVGAAGYGVVFHGSLAGIIGTHPGTADATISSDALISVGALVSGAGDVNGDGFDDVLMASSALVSDPNVFNRGALMAFAGSASGITATGPADALSFIVGEEPQNFGWRFSSAGDIDNDGFADIIVGAGGYNGGLGSEGVAYIFRGSAGGLIGSSVADAYVRLEPGQSGAVRRGNKYGFSVSGGGDINGDGFADVLMGVGLYDAGQTDEGAVFVYHGGPAPINPNQPPVAVAGADQVVVDFDNIGSATFTVDGSASFDPDGTIVAYAWLEGETLLGTSPVLTAALPATGDHGLVLTVTDDAGITRGDAVTIRVDPAASTQILFDSFTSGFGAWVAGGDVTLSSVDTFPTPPQIRLGSSGAFLSRSIAMPIGSTGMTLSFWGKANQFSAVDEMLVKVSIDGGPFTTIHTVSSASSDDSYVFYGGSAIPIGHSWFPATASNIVLRFESNMTTGGFFVDDVKVRAISVPPETPPPPIGELPVANAGGNIAVDDNDNDGFELVFLDGALSTDADGFIVSYQWFEVAPDGGTSMLGTGATLGVSFARGDHSVRLIVTDNDGGSAGSDPIVITVNQALSNNQAPVANASPDRSITDIDGDGEEFVLLDGRASTDADGSIVDFVWTENGNTLSNIPGAGILQEGQLKIILPLGRHTIELTVTDNQGATSTDTLVVDIVASSPTAPIDSFTASPLSIALGESSTLTWTTTGADSVVINAGSNLPLDGSISVSPTVTTLYILTAIGPAGASQAMVTVTITSPPPPLPNQGPTANAGADQTLQDSNGDGAETVTLDGSASTDTGGSIASFEWREAGTLMASGATPAVSLDVGIHTIELTVTDDDGATATDTVVIDIQATTPAGAEFRTQVVKMTIPSGSNSVLSSAFDAVDASRTIALISGITQHAMGWTAESTQDPVEISANVDLAQDGTTLTATRASAMNQPDTVWVLLIEYTGPPGGPNELVVRDRRIHDWSSGQASSGYGPISFVGDNNKTVVFGTGSSNSNTASSNFDRGDVRAWLDASNNVQLVRGDGSGAISSGHQVVEFVGSNWSIQSGDSTPGQDPNGTIVIINPVSSLVNAWVYFNWSSNSANLDERGHRVWLSSANNLRIQEDATATGSKTIRWSIISNPQMQVQSGEADNQFTTSNAGSINGFVAVADMTQSFAWVSGMTDGGGNAHPRDMWQFELQDASTINLQRGRTGQELSYRYFVVELPTGGGSGDNLSPLANAGADQSATDSNGDLEEPFLLDASSSSDPDGTIAIYEWHEGATLLATGVNPIVSLSVGTHTIELTVTDDGGATAAETVVITVDPQQPPAPASPVIDSFSASPTTITAGELATLSWATTDADSVSINGGASQPADGSSTVSPTTTTTYTLVATGAGGTSNASVTVTVNPAPPAQPSVDSFSATPSIITAGDSAVALSSQSQLRPRSPYLPAKLRMWAYSVRMAGS